MQIHDTAIPGCYKLCLCKQADRRGSFIKPFNATAFGKAGLETGFKECYLSTSGPNVLRGMHFQLPPFDGAKLVFCVAGEVFDVALDLRIGSPAYGCFTTCVLSDRYATAVFLPPGVAHGFAVVRAPATLVYCVSTEHSPEYDSGVLWNSCGISWPLQDPVLSERDKKHATLQQFPSPFQYYQSSAPV